MSSGSQFVGPLQYAGAPVRACDEETALGFGVSVGGGKVGGVVGVGAGSLQAAAPANTTKTIKTNKMKAYLVPWSGNDIIFHPASYY